MAQIDTTILQRLINQHGAALRLYACQFCAAPDDAVQEALIALTSTRPVPSDALAWLYVAVRRRAQNLARAAKRRADHHDAAALDRRRWFEPAERDDGIDAQGLLNELPELEREIVVARIWGELSFSQISELVQKPLSTVHRRYQLALQSMAETVKRTSAADRALDGDRPRQPLLDVDRSEVFPTDV